MSKYLSIIYISITIITDGHQNGRFHVNIVLSKLVCDIVNLTCECPRAYLFIGMSLLISPTFQFNRPHFP